MESPHNNQIKRTIDTLFEDNSAIVFYKPAGLLVIPTDKNEQWTLTAIVNQHRGDSIQLFPAHRLDRDTSGAILFAKGKSNQKKLMDFFRERKVKKSYIAFVHGKVREKQGSINIPIKDFHQKKFQKHLPAQSAITLYKVIEYQNGFTVVEVNPVTGRTNQIRIHFAKIGYPLVGEDRYAFRKDFVLKFKRTALHASELSWPNPLTGKICTVNAPLSKDMSNFLEKNR